MFNTEQFFAMIKDMLTGNEGDDMRASIINTSDGGFGVYTREGLVRRYSRARDARRGALRLGYVLA